MTDQVPAVRPVPDDMLRGLPKQVPCWVCGGSRASQTRVSFYTDDERPLCQACHGRMFPTAPPTDPDLEGQPEAMGREGPVDGEPAKAPRSLVEQAGEAAEVAKGAFAAGDAVVGAVAIVLAAQLLQLARLLGQTS